MSVKEHSAECVVQSNTEVAADTWLLSLCPPEDFFDRFTPGQFAHVKIPCSRQMLLRRPFSVYMADRASGTISLIFRVVGDGTEILAECRQGDKLNVLLPLGKGFTIDDGVQNIWLVGGGLGIGALGTVATSYPDRTVRGLFGFRSIKDVPTPALPPGLASTDIVTEDGSQGEQGLITEFVAQALLDGQPDLVLACGPAPMYRALRDVLGTAVPAQISVEERMGCGTGGCETCVCRVGSAYVKSCTEGPIFQLSEVYHQ